MAFFHTDQLPLGCAAKVAPSFGAQVQEAPGGSLWVTVWELDPCFPGFHISYFSGSNGGRTSVISKEWKLPGFQAPGLKP